MKETEIKAIIQDHAVRNRALLDVIKSKGASTSEIRPIDHHFWANSQNEAALLAQKLYQQGFLISEIAPVTTTDNSELWNVEATLQHSPSEAAEHDTVERLTRLAAEFNAVYDGWGTSI